MLKMELQDKDKHYYMVLKEAVFLDEKVTPCYITQMTKAHFKDNSDSGYALKFFEEHI